MWEMDAIITSPPYAKAQEFIERGVDLMKAGKGVVAMLLRVDFDSAKSRRHLFADNPAWSKKIVLNDRIRWFEGESSPSFNHAWYLWNWKHEGPPAIAYASKDVAEVFADLDRVHARREQNASASLN